MTLSESQVIRYSRHILLPAVGGTGQERLLAAQVRIPLADDRAANLTALTYLVAAGVGTLVLDGAVDDPLTAAEVTASMVLGAADVGEPRLPAVRARLAELNPDVNVVAAADGGRPDDATCDCGPDNRGPAVLADALTRAGRATCTTLATLLARR